MTLPAFPHPGQFLFISKATSLKFGGVPDMGSTLLSHFPQAALNLGLCELRAPPLGPLPRDAGAYLRTPVNLPPLSQWKLQSCGYNLVSLSAAFSPQHFSAFFFVFWILEGNQARWVAAAAAAVGTDVWMFASFLQTEDASEEFLWSELIKCDSDEVMRGWRGWKRELREN